MQEIWGFIQDYWKNTDKFFLGLVTVFTAVLVFINYKWLLDGQLARLQGFSRWISYTLLYGIVLIAPLLLFAAISGGRVPVLKMTIVCTLAAGLFAFKVSSVTILETLEHIFRNQEPAYWSKVLNIPLKLLVMTGGMYVIGRMIDPAGPIPGLTAPTAAHARTYGWMLLAMVPLIAIAATLPSFQNYYPKFDKLPLPSGGLERTWKIFLYELSYATDFITIEMFFRGLMVIGLVKLIGPAAIIPVAAFYCAIHFGKPMGECISSYFGGLLLGILAWRTQSIAGGLFMHIGIAWLMEMAGYVSHQLNR